MQFKVDLDLLRDTLRVVTKNNNELKEALKNKEAMLVALSKETTSAEDANNEDLTVSVEIHNEDTNQRTMNKESAAHKCIACDKDFNASGDLERHLKDKHTESVCNMCDKKFTSTKQAQEHICLEGEIVPQTHTVINSSSAQPHCRSI